MTASPSWLAPSDPSWLQRQQDPGEHDPSWLAKQPQSKTPKEPTTGVGDYNPRDPTPADHIIAKYLPTISTLSKKYGVPDWVMKFVVGQESGQTTDPRIRESIRNSLGAAGIVQIMPGTAQGAGVDPLNWQQSLEYAAKALAGNFAATKDWRGAVASYNMGLAGYQGAVARGEALPLETRRYLANFGIAARNSEQRRQQQVAQAVRQGNNVKPPAFLDTVVPGQGGGAAPYQNPQAGRFGGRIGGVLPQQQAEAAAPAAQVLPQMTHSGLMEVAGHQDLPFILANALARDNATMPSPKTIAEQMRDPKSHVYQAWHLYMRDPAQAMDEYGAGSPAQNAWIAQHGTGANKAQAEFFSKHPFLNALTTFGMEQLNPMAWGEGALAGKILSVGPEAARALGLLEHVEGAAQGTARAVGLGSPLFNLRTRGGVEASQWAKATISTLNAPAEAVGLESNKAMMTKIFGGLTPEAQEEVVRLYQGLKPNAAFENEYGELSKRAKLLGEDIKAVEAQQQRAKVLPEERRFKKAPYFPMSRSYDFGPQYELEQQLRGEGAPGGGGVSQHKTVANMDEARATGMVDEDFLAASNYNTWRRQRLQRVAFEDAINRAPASLRRNVEAFDFHNVAAIPPQAHWQPTFEGVEGINAAKAPDEFERMNNAFADFNARITGSGRDVRTKELADELGYEPQFGDPRRITPGGSNDWVHAINLMPNPKASPALERSMIAPQLWDFLRENHGLQRYISTSGTWLPGQEQTWVGKYVAMARNAILSNFFFHPTINVAGNDAAARGIYNLGGPQFGRGGYAINAARSLAMQAGLMKPETFIAGAQEYSHWVDNALKAGGLAEFGEPKVSALGGDYARVMTTPPRNWVERVDRALTKAGDFNRERTFGQKGEQAFAVSLFKDAVQRGGMSDAQAGEMVRQALGDYYNFDPKSPWSMFFFFMPWLKGNMQFWIKTLVRRPQYVTATPHALRNLGLQTDPENYEGAFPTSDYSVPVGGKTYSMPFVGRDVSHVLEAGRQLVGGQPIGAAAPVEQMLAGRATPFVRGALDLTHTIDNYFSPDVKGPENDWRMITNPKAPPEKQFQQAAAYFGSHFIPIPLFTYALQDAARRGMGTQDVVQALITAGGGGYFGEAKLDDLSKRQLSQAQKQYKRAYERYRYNNGDLDELRDAWDRYTDRLKDLGVIQ